MHRETMGYTSLRDMDPKVNWKKFYTMVTGRTKGAHYAVVENLKSIGQTPAISHEESDYLLVFCPVASRVGTDISEALESIPGGKPIILVVMHHNFDAGHVIADSRRQVVNQNVALTVDYLFYEGKLLRCNRNEIAWSAIEEAVGGPASPGLSGWKSMNWMNLFRWSRKHWKVVLGIVVGGLVIYMIVRRALADGSMKKPGGM